MRTTTAALRYLRMCTHPVSFRTSLGHLLVGRIGDQGQPGVLAQEARGHGVRDTHKGEDPDRVVEGNLSKE